MARVRKAEAAASGVAGKTDSADTSAWERCFGTDSAKASERCSDKDSASDRSKDS